MTLNGRLFRITELNQFAANYIATNGQPTQGFAAGFGQARVHLAVDMPTGLPSFLPDLSLKTDANANGVFSISIPDQLQDFRGRLIVFRLAGNTQVPGIGVSVPIYEPIFRSEAFALATVSASEKRIFVQLMSTANEQGVNQSQLTEELGRIRRRESFDGLRGTIKDGRIDCRVRKDGGIVDFDVKLRPNTSEDLDVLVEGKADDIEIDLPGVDFITGLCVDEEQITRQIRRAAREFGTKFSDQIMTAIRAVAPPGFEAFASITVNKLRYPITGSDNVTVMPGVTVPVPVRSVVPDIAVGLPRRL